MADYTSDLRVKDFAVQSSRLPGLIIPVDHASALDNVKGILASIIAPYVKELTAYVGTISKNDIIRVNDNSGTSGNEFKTSIEDLLKVINGLTSYLTDEYAGQTEFVLFDAGGSSAVRKITGTEFVTMLASQAGFTTAVDNIFGDTAFNTAADARITAQITTIGATQLMVDSTERGYLKAYKFGRIACVQIQITNGMTVASWQTVTGYHLPAAWSPSVVTGSSYEVSINGDNNRARIVSGGGGECDIELYPNDSTQNGICLIYLTD